VRSSTPREEKHRAIRSDLDRIDGGRSENRCGYSLAVARLASDGPFGSLIAQSKIGKSLFALFAFVKPIICGGRWFDGTGPVEIGNVLWADTECSAGITIQRIIDGELPAERIKVVFEDDPPRPINLNDPEHLERIEQVIVHHSCRLMVVADDENNSRIAGTLQKLGSIAERTGCTVLVPARRWTPSPILTPVNKRIELLMERVGLHLDTL
jgi:AAA domain